MRVWLTWPHGNLSCTRSPSFQPASFIFCPSVAPAPHPMKVPASDETQPLAARTEAAASPQEPPHGPIHLVRPLIRVAGRGGDSRPPQLQLPAPPHSRPAQLSTLASRPCPAPGVAEQLKSRTPQPPRSPLLRPQQAVGRQWAGGWWTPCLPLSILRPLCLNKGAAAGVSQLAGGGA